MTTLRSPTYGAKWNLAQLLDTGTRLRIWVLPANKAVCLVEEQLHGATGVTCTFIEQAIKHGIVTASLSNGKPALSQAHRVVVGVAPDKVPKVRVETPGSKAATIRVVQNTFVLRDAAKEPPESVELLQRR